MNYTILAYKPDSDDYCMGCVRARYSADFEYRCTESREEAVKFIIEKLKANKKMEFNESGYEITILINGKEVDSGTWLDETETWDYSDKETAQSMMQEAEAMLGSEEADAKAKAEAAEEAQKAADKVRKAQEKEENDAKEYERLKAKFEMKG